MIKRGSFEQHEIDDNRGHLDADITFETPIVGYRAALDVEGRRCLLMEDGKLTIYEGFIWDYASGPVVQTTGMKIASLAHDALCHLTNYRKVPWHQRRIADKYFRELLIEYGMSGTIASPVKHLRSWYSWAGIRLYSSLFAKWRDRK